MADRLRHFTVELPIPGTLAAATEVAGWEVPDELRGRILECELFLRDTGATSGNTDVDVNKNGVTILTAPGLRIAQGSATKRVLAKPTVFGSGGPGHPAGVEFEPGDYITADVDAIPGTASADGVVRLHCVAKDV